jgi:hypothetical protein
MSLNDLIIDTAEDIASEQSLRPFASREEITEAVVERIGENFSANSPFGALAEAAYNRATMYKGVGVAS